MHQAQWSPERPLPLPVSLASQSHHEKPPEVTCTSRGNPGFPASTRERPRETFFNTSRGQSPLPWLGAQDPFALLDLFLLLALGADGNHRAVDMDVNILLLHPRQFGMNRVGFGRLFHIHLDHRRVRLRPKVHRPDKKAAEEIVEWIGSYDVGHAHLLSGWIGNLNSVPLASIWRNRARGSREFGRSADADQKRRCGTWYPLAFVGE